MDRKMAAVEIIKKRMKVLTQEVEILHAKEDEICLRLRDLEEVLEKIRMGEIIVSPDDALTVKSMRIDPSPPREGTVREGTVSTRILDRPTVACDLKDESDPNGIGQHESGAKLDNGKVLAGLVLGDFSRALYAVCEVGTFGARKYTLSGWLAVPDGENRYKDALYRHNLQENWEDRDPDSGLAHAAHRAWNALATLELRLRREERVACGMADELREDLNADIGC